MSAARQLQSLECQLAEAAATIAGLKAEIVGRTTSNSKLGRIAAGWQSKHAIAKAQVRDLTAENEKLRAEVAACDGHGYLRDEISGLKKLLRRTVKLLARPWMERGGGPTVTFDEWEALLTEIDAALGEQEKL